MRKVYVDDLRPGMVLGKTIFNERGDALLARNVVLTSQYVSALRAHGFYAVYVMDGVADDVEPPDILSAPVRIATYRHVRRLFAVAGSIATPQIAEKRAGIPADFAKTGRSRLADLYRDVEKIIDEVTDVATLSGVVSLKSHDNYTFEHSVEVTVAGVLLGQRLNLPLGDLHQLALDAYCHDIGKRVVPPEVLNKPGRLTPEENALMQVHPQAGYEAMLEITATSDIIARGVTWQHHERQDGTGYPRGLRGTNDLPHPEQKRPGQGLILPTAEIAAVADVYCALASDRPYRPALPPVEIINTLTRMAGGHLNERVVTRFLSILPSYPMGTEVEVTAGRLSGYRGVVTEINPDDIHRPKVRMLFDPRGAATSPVEVDTSREREIQLAAAPVRLAPHLAVGA